MPENAQSTDATNVLVPADREPTSSLREVLVGAWALVSCVETDVMTGEVFLPMGDAPNGFILYTPDGYMSAQLSSVDRANFADDDMYKGAPDEYTAAGESYLAYSGPYHVDEARRTVEHGMAVSLFPNWTGDRQLRIVDLDGDILRLHTDARHKRHPGRSLVTSRAVAQC
jgi:hypothetical protein